MSLTYNVLKDDVRAGRPIDFGFVTYVPERTCRDTDHDTKSITCSECGEITRETLFWVDVDGGKTVKGHRPRFCSNCGARLVDE